MFLSKRILILFFGLNVGAVLGVIYSWSLFVLPLEMQYGWTRAQTSFTYTLMLVFFCIGLICGGIFLEKVGVRKTLWVGAFFIGSGFFSASFATTLPMLYLTYGAIAGFGVGIGNVIPTSVCMRWFPERQGLVGGLCHMSLPLGTLIYGFGIAEASLQRFGVASTLQTLGILFLLILLFCSIFLKFPPPNHFLRGTSGTIKAALSHNSTPKEMVASRNYKFIWLWALFIQIGGLMVAGHIIPYAIGKGFSPEYAALAMGFYAVGNGLGKLGLGFLWDFWGRRITMLCNVTFMFLGLLGLTFYSHAANGIGLLVFSAMIAIGYGSLFSLLSVLLMTNYGQKHYGVNFGVSMTPMVLAAFLGPYLGSLIQEISGVYTTALLGAALVSSFGFIMVLCIRDPKPLS